MRYTGIVEVEFKRDLRDGKLKLLDINPRVWGWHSLCGPAGVDYPYLLGLLSTGESIPATQAAGWVRGVGHGTDAPTAHPQLLPCPPSVRAYLPFTQPPPAPR